MLIEFSDERNQALFNSKRDLVRAYGPGNAKLIRQRLDDLRASYSLELARGLPGKLEELKGARKGQFSMRLKGGTRLIFRPADVPPPTKADGGIDWAQVRVITVVEVGDYHD